MNEHKAHTATKKLTTEGKKITRGFRSEHFGICLKTTPQKTYVECLVSKLGDATHSEKEVNMELKSYIWSSFCR